MRLALLARNPTDSVTHGFLPAAIGLGLHVTLLTDQPQAHAAQAHTPGATIDVVGCEVTDHRAVISALTSRPATDGVFTNSDHLQTPAALAADYLGLPGKDWRATLRCKNKGLMRRHLRAAGLDAVWSTELAPGTDPATLAGLDLTYPCIIKPREGVASEDVVLSRDADDLVAQAARVQASRPGATILVEDYLPGDLLTLETIGDGRVRHVLGGFRTELSPLPHFVEERLRYVPQHPEPIVTQVLAQLDALGVGLGACHTEFVVHEGRARLIEVNYRAIGDQCDLLLAQLLDLPYFELVLGTHLGTALPTDLAPRRDGAARVEYPCATTAGTLRRAPEACDRQIDGVALSYRPLRACGERHPVHHTNRDYLGVVRATGRDQAAVDRVVEEFLAAQHYEIVP